jgi:hypothetical protein
MVILHNFFNPKHFPYFLDKYKDLPVTLFMDYLPKDIKELSINPFNIFLLHEPNELFGVHNWVVRNANHFQAILTYNPYIIENFSQAIPFTFNGLITDKPEQFEENLKGKEKKFEVTFLCGVTKWSSGHQFRQRIYPLKKHITIPKQWYYVLEDFDVAKQVRPGYAGVYSKDLSHVPEDWGDDTWGKRSIYEESMFHVAVENCLTDNWYTEKIGQAFTSKTVPIYWGCPNLGDLGYDERGIIRFKDEEDLVRVVNNLTPQDYYDRLPYIEYNYQVTLQDTFRIKLSNILDQIIELNNL